MATDHLLAIVGSVDIVGDEAADLIRQEIRLWDPRAVVSGGAKGADSMAANIAMGEFGLPVIECLPAQPGWQWYKPRNLLIAEICTALVCIRSRYSTTYGSGWTADKAHEMGKPVTRHLL